LVFISLLALLLVQNSCAIDCLDNAGNAIDWWSAIDIPN